MKREKIKDSIEIFKNLVEIAAIIIAGIWTYTMFIKKEEPSLHPITKIESSLVWIKSTNSNFVAQFNVDFSNVGVTPIDINKVHLSAVEFSRISLEKNQTSKYIDINTVRKSAKPLIDTLYDRNDIRAEQWNPLLAKFPPGSSWKQTFEFLIIKKPDTGVIFLVELYNDNEKIDGTYQWGYIGEK